MGFSGTRICEVVSDEHVLKSPWVENGQGPGVCAETQNGHSFPRPGILQPPPRAPPSARLGGGVNRNARMRHPTPPAPALSRAAVTVTRGQLRSENMKWKSP